MRTRVPLKLVLWLVNGISWLSLIGLATWHAQSIFFADEPTTADLKLSIEALLALVLLDGLTSRNPFDANGNSWQVAGSATPTVARSSGIGIIVLPGVGVAMTDRGTVKMENCLTLGAFFRSKQPVESSSEVRPDGPKDLDLPSSTHPTLKQLNQAGVHSTPPHSPSPSALLNQMVTQVEFVFYCCSLCPLCARLQPV